MEESIAIGDPVTATYGRDRTQEGPVAALWHWPHTPCRADDPLLVAWRR